MNISEVLKKENIVLGVSAKNKTDAIEKMIAVLYSGGTLTDKTAFTEDVMARERVSSTGIGNGIAIPHGKSPNVRETAVAVARLTDTIDWGGEDSEPVKFIVLLAVNENDKGNTHVKILSQMARKLASPQTCERLMNASGADEIVDIFSE